MKMEYSNFLNSKVHGSSSIGFKPKKIHEDVLYPFQVEITKWAIEKGRAAIFADCGMGKTLIQLEWAREVNKKSKRPVLIVAPLAVSSQTVEEARSKLDLKITYTRGETHKGINITNYEMIHKFNPDDFSGIVLDESSILKNMYGGKYRVMLNEFARSMDYRLCCTATPAPNDLVEIINHSEFLGILNGKEVIGLYFTADGASTQQYKLKGHASEKFWRWVATWAVACRNPSDVGYPESGFELPKLNMKHHVLHHPVNLDKGFFSMGASDLNSQRAARKASIKVRIEKAKDIINKSPDSQWLIWCDLNDESSLAKTELDAVEVKGNDSIQHKEKALLDFANGKIDRLVTKPSIAGFGMNWQGCHNVIFLGLSHSYEKFYQAIRRVWRYGQKNKVTIHTITTDADRMILENIKRKEKNAEVLMDKIISNMRDIQLDRMKSKKDIKRTVKKGNNWKMILGDSIEEAKNIEANSVGLSVFSPPFPGMYVYTDMEEDIGNSKSMDELINHMNYLIPSLYKMTIPGRSCCIHLTQGVTYKWQEGYIGVKDFRGKIIEAMQNHGWIYYGEVTIDKNPQVKAIRTKDQGLLFKTLAKDSANMHMALADYILQFRKPGENPEPIKSGISERYNNKEGWITSDEWIRWARPIWYASDYAPDGDGIRETNTLNVRKARGEKDEKHLCPLQLGVIERCIKLWSNPGDLVFSPFAGIGSEGYVSLKFNRKFMGIELKPEYFKMAVLNLKSVKSVEQTGQLF